MSTSDNLIKEIKKETARRKQLWQKMLKVGKEVMTAAKKEARKQGISGMNWFRPDVQEKFTSIHYEVGKEVTHGRMSLLPSGEVIPPWGSSTYGGYPELADADPDAFRIAAIEKLMGMINEYED